MLALFRLFRFSSLHAWGRGGHEIVTILAEQRLVPEVGDKVVTVLDGRDQPFSRATIYI